MKVSLKGLLINGAKKGYEFSMEELFKNLEEVRKDKSKIDEFFELYI